MLIRWTLFFLIVSGIVWCTQPAAACPFCDAVSPSLNDEIDTAAVAVIATLRAPGDPALIDPEATKAEFNIARVIKGEELLEGKRTLRATYMAEIPPGSKFLILGNDPPNLSWPQPNKLTPRGWEYLNKMLELPRKGPERLLFALPYLEDEEEMLRFDAYDEFATTPYARIRELGPQLNPDDLIQRIANPAISAKNVRLYCTLLGVCGEAKHADALEAMLRSGKPQFNPSLDAMIAAYLRLKKADGLPLIEKLFLMSEAANDSPKANAAISALRFHGQEGDIIPQAQVVEVMRGLLARPQLAARVLADLARWSKKPEDWRDIDRAAELFEQGKGDTLWVREPAAAYLAACPLPKAKAHLERLAKIDPAAVKRGMNPGLPESSTVYLGGGPVVLPKKKVKAPATKAPATAAVNNSAPANASAPQSSMKSWLWTLGAPVAGGLLAVVLLTWGLRRRPGAA